VITFLKQECLIEATALGIEVDASDEYSIKTIFAK
jgi:hypothetical protein